MKAPLQQVNLYRVDHARQAANAGARALVLSMVGTLVIVGLVALGGEFYLSHLSGQREQVAGQLQNSQTQLAKLRAALPDNRTDPFLTSELQRLEANYRHLDDSLGVLRRHLDEGQPGFSAIFAGLARNTLDGIWFSDVGVSAGGSALLLRGQTTEPARSLRQRGRCSSIDSKNRERPAAIPQRKSPRICQSLPSWMYQPHFMN